MAGKSEQIIKGLESLVKKELTDDEKDSVVCWQKFHELAHFVQGFPQDWLNFKEMLVSYLDDLHEQWMRLTSTAPGSTGELAVMHAQVYGARRVINSFIEDVETAPEKIRDIPEIIRENAEQLRNLQE